MFWQYIDPCRLILSCGYNLFFLERLESLRTDSVRSLDLTANPSFLTGVPLYAVCSAFFRRKLWWSGGLLGSLSWDAAASAGCFGVAVHSAHGLAATAAAGGASAVALLLRQAH